MACHQRWVRLQTLATVEDAELWGEVEALQITQEEGAALGSQYQRNQWQVTERAGGMHREISRY